MMYLDDMLELLLKPSLINPEWDEILKNLSHIRPQRLVNKRDQCGDGKGGKKLLQKYVRLYSYTHL